MTIINFIVMGFKFGGMAFKTGKAVHDRSVALKNLKVARQSLSVAEAKLRAATADKFHMVKAHDAGGIALVAGDVVVVEMPDTTDGVRPIAFVLFSVLC